MAPLALIPALADGSHQAPEPEPDPAVVDAYLARQSAPPKPVKKLAKVDAVAGSLTRAPVEGREGMVMRLVR